MISRFWSSDSALAAPWNCLGVFQTYQGIDPSPRDSDSVGLKWGPRINIFKKTSRWLFGATKVENLRSTQRKYIFGIPWLMYEILNELNRDILGLLIHILCILDCSPALSLEVWQIDRVAPIHEGTPRGVVGKHIHGTIVGKWWQRKKSQNLKDLTLEGLVQWEERQLRSQKFYLSFLTLQPPHSVTLGRSLHLSESTSVLTPVNFSLKVNPNSILS